MNVTLRGGSRSGAVRIPASKSQAHRLLILAALAQEETTLLCDGISADIAATAACLNALGAKITEQTAGELHITPIRTVPQGLLPLPCGESGSTLRFLLPVAGALGAACVFRREGRLPRRPLAPFDRELTAHGMTLR
ncbi:MAG: 3-phosphoshikimate 1-carboxyvinyltransferase, partial [Oscillospiraceae bacterium]|nr:3-phosphoshikimate 1-carboxyvinyltransferase [Oscillospiraceae bacterium]